MDALIEDIFEDMISPWCFYVYPHHVYSSFAGLENFH